jgi:electron transfer flavoprotein beta subunit
MNVVVCIKQVPETTEVKINPETGTLMREGVPAIVNPFDLYALEEGLRLREKFGGKVTVITMGPPQAKEALLETIALGADDAILVSDRAFAGADTLATSYTLARVIARIGAFDLIICGKQAIDGDTAQVGPGIAECLDVPFVAFVKKIESVKHDLRQAENRSMRVERMMEEGYDVIELPLPAVITVVKEINEPRMPSLRGKMRAKKYQPVVWTANDLDVEQGRIGLTGSPTQVIKVFTPELRRAGEVWHGTTEELVDKLYERLKEAKIIF